MIAGSGWSLEKAARRLAPYDAIAAGAIIDRTPPPVTIRAAELTRINPSSNAKIRAHILQTLTHSWRSAQQLSREIGSSYSHTHEALRALLVSGDVISHKRSYGHVFWRLP